MGFEPMHTSFADSPLKPLGYRTGYRMIMHFS